MTPTAPTYFTAGCVGCEAPRTFELEDADSDDGTAVYECEDCGHEAHLDLDP